MKRLTGAIQRCLGLVLIMMVMSIVMGRAQGQMFMQGNGLRFEENRGQIVDTRKQSRPDILFTVESQGLKFFLRRTGTSHVFYRWSAPDSRLPIGTHGGTNAAGNESSRGGQLTSYRLDMELMGANINPQVHAEHPSSDHANYYAPYYVDYRGQVPGRVEGVRSYERVTLVDVYPGIDMVYHSQGDALKYDLVVRPGGDVRNIRLQYLGADTLLKGEDGSVLVKTQYGDVTEAAPEVYQVLDDGRRVEIEAAYRISGRELRFEVGSFDPRVTLVIDPVLRWSTFLGGTGTDVAEDIACHPAHDTGFTVAGSTSSIDFPTTSGVAQTSKTPSRGAYSTSDAFIARFNVSGQRLWVTYLGGNEDDGATVAGLDESANTYVAGFTASSDFPTTPGAFQPLPQPGASFIAKLNVVGRLEWSTYFHGAAIRAIAIAPNRDVAIGGVAWGNITVTPGAFQMHPPYSGEAKGFIAKFDGGGSLRWSTYYGGTPGFGESNAEVVTSLVFNRTGELFACGWTVLADFPVTVGCFQATIGRSNDRNDPEYSKRDGWVAKLTAGGMPLWSTFCGGSRRDMLEDIALDPSGNPVVVGASRSLDFPTTEGTYASTRDRTDSLATDGVIVKFNAEGDRLWGTYFGGSGLDEAREIAISPDGSAWIGFSAASASFPVTPDAYINPEGSGLGGGLVKLDGSGQRLWATMLSRWNNSTLPQGICANRQGCIVCGVSGKNFITTPGSFQREYAGGGWDAMMMMFCDFSLSIEPRGQINVCQGDSVVLTAAPGLDWYRWSNGATTRSITVGQSGTYLVSGAKGDCAGSASEAVNVWVIAKPQRRLKASGPTTFCTGDSVVLYTDRGIGRYRWSTGDTTRQLVVRQPGSYSLFFADSNGCTNTTDTLLITVTPRPVASISLLGPNPVCEGSATKLDAGPGHSGYQWSTGETTQSIQPAKSGFYTVRVLRADGCWSESSAPFAVQVNPRPKVTIRSMLPTQFCEGDSTVLLASATMPTGARYEWSNGATGARVVIRKGGVYTVRVTDSTGCTAEASMMVGVALRPNVRIQASGPTRFCAGDSVVLSVGPHTMVQWSTGENNSSVVAKLPGKYFAMVADQEGCAAATDTIIVELAPRPAAQMSGPASVCSNGRAVYSAVSAPNVRYEWEVQGGGGTIVEGADQSTVTVQWGASGKGSVRLRMQDMMSGCGADTAISVAIGSGLVPVVALNRPPVLCPGDSVVLDAGIYASYLWSNGERTRTLTVRTPGSYTVAVTDAGGCAGSSAPVEVRFAPRVDPVIAVPNDGRFCSGDSLVLDAGEGYGAYLWSNGFTSRRITVRSAGTYDVLVTDDAGCTWRAPSVSVMPIALPSVAIAGPRGVCAASSAEYVVPEHKGSTFTWAAVGGEIVAGQGTSRVRVEWGPMGEGSLSVRQAMAEGCIVDAESFAVHVGDSLEPLVSPSGIISLCEDAAVTLDAGEGYTSYQWSNGATTRTTQVNTPGTYTVRVSNSDGCRGTSSTIQVVRAERPRPVLSHKGRIDLCEGDSILLRTDDVFAGYEWSTGAHGDRLVVRASGRYVVTAASADGCLGTSDTVEVVVHALPARPTVLVEKNRFTASDAYGYQWYRDGAAIAGATSQEYSAAEPGNYAVEVANAAGCRSVSSAFSYHSVVPRLVWLDTVTANVGERLRLAMKVDPPLTEADDVRGYRAGLSFDPAALFVHDVISPDRTTAGDPTSFRHFGLGRIVVDRGDGAGAIVGDRLFDVEFEGLISGQPVNTVKLDSITLLQGPAATPGGHGIVILIGCEVGTPLTKPVRILKLQPNPSTGVAEMQYRAPAGSVPQMRLLDAIGHEVLRRDLNPGTGEDERLRLVLGEVSSGLYWIELTVAGERTSMPIIVTQ